MKYGTQTWCKDSKHMTARCIPGMQRNKCLELWV